MKIFFDTNVYVAEALSGPASTRLLEATQRAKWRLYVSDYVLDEVERVLVDQLGFSSRLAHLSRRRCLRRAVIVTTSASGHIVPNDPKDSPILGAAVAAKVDYLVTNDRHLRTLNPHEGVQIVSTGESSRSFVNMEPSIRDGPRSQAISSS